jgi:sugar (pentulose or hexulose) kinase
MPASRESSALGAARLGFQALGVAADWVVDLPLVHEPDAAAHEFYRDLGARRRAAIAAIEAGEVGDR